MNSGVSVIVFKDGSLVVRRVSSEREHLQLLDEIDVDRFFSHVFLPPGIKVITLELVADILES